MRLNNDKMTDHRSSHDANRENQTQFENQIKPRMYVGRITRSSMYMYEKLHFVSQNLCKEK